ncbi:MAG: HAD family hydrolase [Chloroflexi bacterium]|jgi:phosphoglycolate phosphatase|nr:HAD family hydrolase [Anaerolineaceae bacterium]NMB88815.1 HAD family hydrolase [Chloroflexota bacterium]
MTPHTQDDLNTKNIEVLHDVRRGQIKYALFDFDGTVSLIREGWQPIMIGMMTGLLMQTPRHESEEQIHHIVKTYVTELTGKQTIYQMIRLAEEIENRGGVPLEPLAYKHEYHDRLMQHIQERIHRLENGQAVPEEMAVPGSLEFIQALKARGIACFLASGTDEKYVMHEAELLGLPPYFDGIFGALDDYKKFNKKMVIDRIIQQYSLSGDEFVSFGDGYVEIENTKSVNGIAVGVATNEAERQGIDEWKRSRLIAAGADLIIPDFREHVTLMQYLFSE